VRDAGLPAQGTLELIVRNLPNGARVEVAADGPETRFSEPPPEMGGGPAFGLLLLDRLADAWGSQSYPYRVWFEIASSPVRRR